MQEHFESVSAGKVGPSPMANAHVAGSPKSSPLHEDVSPTEHSSAGPTRTDRPQHIVASTSPQPQWNANYIAQPTTPPRGRRPSSPGEAAAGARSPEELLRRLSITTQNPLDQNVADFNPRETFPELQLSGNVISATFCVPFKIRYGSDGQWVCHPSNSY